MRCALQALDVQDSAILASAIEAIEQNYQDAAACVGAKSSEK